MAQGASGKRQAKVAGKSSGNKKNAKDLEESKEGTHVEERSDGEEELENSHAVNDDEIMNKFGFRQKIEIELSLPTDEKEFILDFEMKFLDRNY